MMANTIIYTSCDINICSYNMHGFNCGVSYVKSLCENYDIIFLQEHWLLSCNLFKLEEIDKIF